ncbi:hypothetical protein [Oceanibaculum indicum]|uniref:Uncharacterized protein n=1 Tax=Oceanibaculum indicum P24 TaxID=1207063 RepID=K2KLU5_9PROT|nr:hypothetical protein [Oceanibaculum indicum]EKE78425.1 hypothetical protein P24_02656 [Oceanibaculum indicum P24]
MALLGYLLLENLALDAELTGGNWNDTEGDMLDPRIESAPARAAGLTLADTKITMTWESARYCTDLVVCGHTGGLDGRYRATAYEGEAQIAQIDWTDIFGRIYDTSDLPWEQSNWFTGKPREQDIAGYARHLRIRWPELIAPTSIELEFDVTTNAVDFDLGYLFAGNPLSPRWTYSRSREMGIRSNTLRDRTAGGRQILSRRTGARTQRVTFQHLSKGEAARLYDYALREDIHPAIFVPDPNDNVHEFREVFPAWLSVVSAPRQTSVKDEWSITINLEEMQG